MADATSFISVDRQNGENRTIIRLKLWHLALTSLATTLAILFGVWRMARPVFSGVAQEQVAPVSQRVSALEQGEALRVTRDQLDAKIQERRIETAADKAEILSAIRDLRTDINRLTDNELAKRRGGG